MVRLDDLFLVSLNDCVYVHIPWFINRNCLVQPVNIFPCQLSDSIGILLTNISFYLYTDINCFNSYIDC